MTLRLTNPSHVPQPPSACERGLVASSCSHGIQQLHMSILLCNSNHLKIIGKPCDPGSKAFSWSLLRCSVTKICWSSPYHIEVSTQYRLCVVFIQQSYNVQHTLIMLITNKAIWLCQISELGQLTCYQTPFHMQIGAGTWDYLLMTPGKDVKTQPDNTHYFNLHETVTAAQCTFHLRLASMHEQPNN